MPEAEWEVISEFPYMEVMREKHCDACKLTFRTGKAAMLHIVEAHSVLSERRSGPITVQKVAQRPWSIGQRTLSVNTEVLFNGEKIPSNVVRLGGWNADAWAEGAAWAFAQLRVEPYHKVVV